jgi:hypothetical protein
MWSAEKNQNARYDGGEYNKLVESEFLESAINLLTFLEKTLTFPLR